VADVHKPSDDTNKARARENSLVDKPLDGKPAKSHGDSFTSFSGDAVSQFAVEDHDKNISVTAHGVKQIDDVNQHLKELKEKVQKGPPVQYMGNVSQGYREKIEKWWSTVPEPYKKLMERSKIHIVVVEDARQIYKDADKIPARGHHGDSLATTGGMFSPALDSVVMVEKNLETAGAKKAGEKWSAGGLTMHGHTEWEVVKKAWHELGHAFDHVTLKHLAHSKEFADAYQLGLNRLTDLDKRNWDYFLSKEQSPAKGHEMDKPHEEMLAEIFALAHVPQDKLFGSELRMLAVFEEVVELMRSKKIMPPANPATSGTN